MRDMKALPLMVCMDYVKVFVHATDANADVDT